MSEKRFLDLSEENTSESKRLKLTDEAESKSCEQDDNKNAYNVIVKEECVEVCVDDEETNPFTTEKDVGITQYVSDHQGFIGIIKQRYSDFLVWECDSDGKIVHLDDLKPPERPLKKESDMSVLKTLPEDIQTALKKLTESDESDSVQVPIQDKSKEERKALHEAFRALHPDMQSHTKGDAVKYIHVFKSSKKDKRQERLAWPEGKPDFVCFALYKENLDTMEAVNLLAKRLRIGPPSFHYAGTKDKRGKTTQWVCVRRISPEQLISAASTCRGISIGNFSYKKRGLDLGDLTGNRFSLVLRGIDAPGDVVNGALENVRDRGFINYFGLQRFGTTSVPTHHVGKEILKENWEKAVTLILTPRLDDESPMNRIRRYWCKYKDSDQAVKMLKKWKVEHTIEGKLIHAYRQTQGNCRKVIDLLPRNLKLMYLHAYQSFIFNTIVDKRISKYKLNVLSGDLKAGKRGSDKRERSACKAKVILDSEIDHTDISEIVLPLPGFDVISPSNEIKDWITDILETDGITTQNFYKLCKKYGLPGSYRKILIKPQDMNWKFVKYKDIEVPLLLSDKDILDGVNLPEQPPDAPHTAVVVEFTLPPSGYATMLFREAMKIDTAAKSMANLQQYIASKQETEIDKKPKMKNKKLENNQQVVNGQHTTSAPENCNQQDTENKKTACESDKHGIVTETA